MAVGSVQQGPFVCYVEHRAAKSTSQTRRNVVAAALIGAALCGAVLVVLAPSAGVSTAEKAALTGARAAPKSVKLALKTSVSLAPKDSHLALELIRGASTQSLEALHKMVKNWQDKMIASDDDDVSRGVMLSAVPRSITQALQASDKLCAKKDLIFNKFDLLLKKLGAESFNRNQTDAAAEMAADASLKAWLDSESGYRLQVEKKKQAEEGAKFARDRYEKWAETVRSTRDRLDKMKVKYAEENQDIADQRLLLKEVLRMLGILSDVPLDDVGKAAGGYVSKKATKPSTLTLSQVRAKIAQLKKEAALGGPISLKEVSLLQSKLANFAESDEVKNLLMSMLKDLDMRSEVINAALAITEKELEAHTAKLINYEKEVVDLSNAADTANMKAKSDDLKRQELNGQKINAAETYQDEHASYVVVAPPAGNTPPPPLFARARDLSSPFAPSLLTLSRHPCSRGSDSLCEGRVQTTPSTSSRSSWPKSTSTAPMAPSPLSPAVKLSESTLLI